MSEPTNEPAFPLAELRPLRARSWAWLLPVFAVALALVLAGRAWSARGPELVLHATEGHGIGPGDRLLYRGIAVGDVRTVDLAADLSTVEVRVRLHPAAERLARAGSRFWIERPDISLERLRGVETLLGARHLSVLPGAPDAEAQHEFVCLDEAPVLVADDQGALEFVLEAPRRFGLAPGAPLTYRQIEIGSVTGVGLSSDARSVEVRCAVRGAFAHLVREDTAFWEAGGLGVSFELLQGLQVDFESVRSLLVGGIALSTPTRPGPPARTGQIFTLHAGPEDEWLLWRPSLPIGSDLLPSGTPTPRLLRARLVWEEGFFGRRHTKSGWVLTLPNGVIGPSDLLLPPEGADEPALEVRGERLPLSAPAEAVAFGVARIGIAWPEVVKWPLDRVRAMEAPEDCLVVSDPGAAPMALSASRLFAANDGEEDTEANAEVNAWRVDAAISFDETWHGAVVLTREDGQLVGLLRVRRGRGTILPVVGVLR